MTVVVIGAGCAGLAAAVRLAHAGQRVVVVERAPRLGGRATAFTDKATGERVDNGQHALFGCYRETYDFLRRVGTAHLAPPADRLHLAMIGGGRRFDLVCPSLPAPWHLIAGLLRWRALSISDRLGAIRIGRLLMRARRVGAERVAAEVPADLTVEQWLAAQGQSARIVDWLWRPLALAALNQSPAVAAARPFVRVAAELFGPAPQDAAVALSRVALDDLYAEPARQFVELRGGRVIGGLSARVALDAAGTIRGVHAGDEFLPTQAVVSAVPWFDFDSIWNDGVPAALRDVASAANRMRAESIVTVNLWTDGPVIDVPFVGLVDGPVHWVFDKARIVGEGASHLALVTSGAGELAALENDAVTRRAWEHLQAVVPGARARVLRRSIVVRERRASFSVAPGSPDRPGTVTPIEGLFLAGDWTDTGLPATIEGAVLSGHRAAAAVLARTPPV